MQNKKLKNTAQPKDKKKETNNKLKKKSSTTVKRPNSAMTNKRKISGTPLPTSGPDKKQLLQQRQHSIAKKEKGKNMRLATPKAGTPKSIAANVPAFRFSNLLQTTNTESTQKNIESTKLSKPKPSILTASISISSNIVSELEEKANKKLNKHCNSLDNTDWVAQYAKLRSEININSPREAEVINGRVSANSIRPVEIENKTSPKLFFFPKNTNLDSNIPAIALAEPLSEKFTNRIAKINEHPKTTKNVKVEGTKQRPIIISYQNNLLINHT